MQFGIASVLARDLSKEEAQRVVALSWALGRGCTGYGNRPPIKTVIAEAESLYEFLKGAQ